MSNLKVLNLFSGIGGNRKLWEGVDVVAVDNDKNVCKAYQYLYPSDTVICGDAFQYLYDHYQEFDFIWASPPCQSHTKLAHTNKKKVPLNPDKRLYEVIRFLQIHAKGEWIVENVKPYYRPEIPPTTVLGRHFIWGSTFFFAGSVQHLPGMFQLDRKAHLKTIQEYLGITLEQTIYLKNSHSPIQVYRNCVHPLLGKHVLESIYPGIYLEFGGM